jgi:hypothetical protein
MEIVWIYYGISGAIANFVVWISHFFPVPVLPFITITTKFLSKHRIERVLDTEMNGYHCFNFTEKLSYEV